MNRKEEIVARCFGVIDPGHPYIEHIYTGGDWLLGGEIELLVDRVTYGDGLDRWRKTPKQIFSEFAAKGADVVFAFQTRNPTHAGHAYLMRTGRERLLKMGYTNPVLLLSPLGGWTKADDVPLDVRVKQHQAVLDEGMLDPSWTVMGIWPAPMIYAGPTEVQFHAASRRNRGRELLRRRPRRGRHEGLGRRAVVARRRPVRRRPRALRAPDEPRARGPGDEAHLVRQVLLRQGRPPDEGDGREAPRRLHLDLGLEDARARAPGRDAVLRPDPVATCSRANCVPQGFMVQSGWDIVCDYYQHIDTARGCRGRGA